MGAPSLLLLLACLALLVAVGLLVFADLVPRWRANRRLQEMLQPPGTPVAPPPRPTWHGRVAAWVEPRLDSGSGRLLLPVEDRELLERAGLESSAGASYVAARLGAAALLVLAILLLGAPAGALGAWLQAFAAAGGLMLPKFWLRLRARRRRAALQEELPLLADLLRLLQGSGMSLDQSLWLASTDFRSSLPVLGAELGLAQRQHAAGRTRAESLRRLARFYESESVDELVALLIQLDRHGGAVDEPLRRFGLRLRERRRAQMRASIGQRNVHMTLAMVATLLPALLLVLGGPAFLALARTMGRTL